MLELDPDCQAAVDLAKMALPDGCALGAEHILPALCHATGLRTLVPDLLQVTTRPIPVRTAPGKAKVSDSLQPILTLLANSPRPVTPVALFSAVASSEAGRTFLRQRGLSEAQIAGILATASPEPPKGSDRKAPSTEAAPAAAGKDGWRESPERESVIRELASFGRMLTVGDLPERDVKEREDALREVFLALCQMTRRNAILLGPPGTGKTAIVYELARRLARGDSSIPPMLRDCDVFELSPTFLRSGASVVGEYETRVKKLLEILRDHPKVVLFVDEIHSLLQSGVHDRGPFSDANEAFKAALGHGELSCIGCTTPAEYRRFIEPDKALDRRFAVVKLAPSSKEETVRILQARRPRIETYYKPLRVPDAVIERVVSLTDEYLPSRYQPDKSIRVLDTACARCALATPPLPEVTEDSLLAALESTIGRGLRIRKQISEESVFEELASHVVGQDDVLRGIAQAFVAGLGGWRRDTGPRGVFLFGGPTGVGKTETAVLLSKVLGGGTDAIVRVDCSSLTGSGHDGGPSINRLLGVPPGYVGYARGQGGILSRVRDLPESVILFDEFEKASSGVGELLLRILDDGRIEDVDGNMLDFRRSFVILTTNAGAVYDARHAMGFGNRANDGPIQPGVNLEALWADLRGIGLREEFFGRLQNVFLFQALGMDSILRLIETQLGRLRDTARQKGFDLTWEPELVTHVAAQWQPRFGVRHLTVILRNRVAGQISAADAQGDLVGVSAIQLVGADTPLAAPDGRVAATARRREGSTLVIALA